MSGNKPVLGSMLGISLKDENHTVSEHTSLFDIIEHECVDGKGFEVRNRIEGEKNQNKKMLISVAIKPSINKQARKQESKQSSKDERKAQRRT